MTNILQSLFQWIPKIHVYMNRPKDAWATCSHEEMLHVITELTEVLAFVVAACGKQSP